MTRSSFLDEDELLVKGFHSIGSNCKISRYASVYGSHLITIGNNVRIDDFCILSPSATGGLFIGSNVHIAPYCLLSGREAIRIGDFVNISSRVSIYSSSDDFSGLAAPGPQTLLDVYEPFESAAIDISSYSIIGCGSVILPGAGLREGAAIGALSLVKDTVPEFTVYAGTPARFLRPRDKTFLRSIDV